MEEKRSNAPVTMHGAFCQQIDGISQKYSAKNAVTYMRNSGQDDKLTFQMIYTFIHGAKKEFDRIGLVPGDRVAIISPHSPWAVFMGMALAYSGITIALIDASLPQEEIESLLDYSDVKAVFTTEVMYNRFRPNIVGELPFFCLDEGLKIIPFNKELADCLSLPASKDVDKDVIAILYSSGTTGQMKGIMVTYESVLKAREVFVRLSGLKDYMTYMLVLPFNHIAGFTGAMTFFLTGCEIGFIEDVNASKLQSGLTKFQPHYFAMVPKVFEVMEQKIRAAIRAKGKSAERLMNTLFKVSKFFRKNFGINIGRKMFHSITAQVFGENIFGIGTGASPCKDETAEFFLNLGLEWANLYATTETSVPIVATGIMDRYPVGTVGNVNHHPEIQVKIGHPDQNGIGEILVRSQLMMKGYFKRPDLTAEAFEDGYFKTGDYGYIDRKGYLHITGRIKESVILQSGKKVSPSDVDDYYQERLPDYDIASRGIAVQNGSYDELHLFVANQNDSAAEQSAVCAAIKQVSASAPDMYKLSDIHFVSAIPRTSVGKVKRFCLTLENAPEVQAESTEKSSSPDQLIAIIQKHCKAQQVSMNSKLRDDLGLDSLNMFEIVCAIDDEFHVDISSELDGVVTVGDVCELLTKTSAKESMRYPKPKDAKTIRRLKRWIRSVSSTFMINPQFCSFCPLQKCLVGHAEHGGGLSGRQFAVCPPLIHAFILRRFLNGSASKLNAPGPRRRDPLRLPLAYELPLRLRHIGKKLQHDIRDQLPGQVTPLPGIQQGHIQNHDGNALLLRQIAPLIQNLVVISPQPVDALDEQGVARLDFSAQPPVARTIKVLARFLVQNDVLPGDPRLQQSNPLPVLILILR